MNKALITIAVICGIVFNIILYKNYVDAQTVDTQAKPTTVSDWEEYSKDVFRMKIPEGYLYTVSMSQGVGMTFVPNPPNIPNFYIQPGPSPMPYYEEWKLPELYQEWGV